MVGAGELSERRAVNNQQEYKMSIFTETEKSHKIGTFLVQKVSKGDTEYSQTFHSRVVFP